MEDLNLATLPKYLSDESEAWMLLERLRWHGTPVCPHCGTADEAHYFLNAKSGLRTTKKGSVSYRRIWKCRDKDCRKQFSVLVGTVFESSKVPVSKWLLALYLTAAAKNCISALELQRHLGLGSYQTAWFMLHRLREAMKREPLAGLMSGTVVMDETFYGGKPKNKHQQGNKNAKHGAGSRKNNAPKTPVLALLDAETGEVRTKVVANVTGAELRTALVENVDLGSTHLMTDAYMGYRAVGKEMRKHSYVDHSSHEYVRYEPDGTITSNMAESFFAQFKRSLDGTYHNVSRHHLVRYVTEMEHRWNTRKLTDHERVAALLQGATGKRLTYRPLNEG